MKSYFTKTLLAFFFIGWSLVACNQKSEEDNTLSLESEFPEQTTMDVRLNLNDYLRYKKLHSWGDSLYFLVVSWGSDSTGSYTIMLADSTSGSYTSISQHKQGGVVQSWVNDFDRDSLPEIGIVTRSPNKRRTGQMRLHELGRNLTFETIEMQPLSEQLGADYEGSDIFYPETGQIIREFRTLSDDTAEQEKPIRRIIYGLDNNQLIVTEFENEEDETEQKTPQEADEPEENEGP